MNPPATSRRLRSLPPLVLACGASLLGLLLVSCLKLWPAWQTNPDLSHGFFAPLIFALLVWESRQQGPPRWLRTGTALLAGQTAALGAAFLLFAFAGLLAASVSWSHDLVNFALTGSLGLFLVAGLLIFAADSVRLVPLNWISLTAIFLWLLAAPLPHGTTMRVTLQLQAWVTTNVVHALHLFGVPARQSGNVIELARSSVGIMEACSGIRSLLSCLYAGFFFAAWIVRRPAGRALLIVLAPLLAIGMNFLRSLTLTLMVNAGVEIEGFWHDATGFAILGLTALTLALVAMALESKTVAAPLSPQTPPPATPAARWQPRLFLAALTLTVALGAFYALRLRPAPRDGRASPNLAELLPREADGWQVYTNKELYRFSSALRSEHLAERTYFKPIDGKVVHLTVYLAYWGAGQVPVSAVAAHTPDACWPGAGWSPLPQPLPQRALPLAARTLPLAEYRQFTNAGSPPEHVWFWHLYDGRAINYRDPYSVRALLEIALQYGFRREGPQVFVRVSSNDDWERLANEPLVRQIFTGLHPLGL